MQRAIDFLGVVSLPLLSISLAAPVEILHLLFGSDFDRGENALPVLMATFVLICFGYVAENLIIITAQQNRYAKNAVAALIFNVAANIWLTPKYGLIAAAWITLATQLFVLGLAIHAALPHLPRRPQLRGFLLAVLSAGVAALAGRGAVELGLGLPGACGASARSTCWV